MTSNAIFLILLFSDPSSFTAGDEMLTFYMEKKTL